MFARGGAAQTFNDFLIRVLLGKETFYSPYLSINESHVVRNLTMSILAPSPCYTVRVLR
jgi:hypothetical protein